MPCDIIEKYLNDTLKPQLVSFYVPDKYIVRIIITVREQMLSCISHWNDIQFRKTLLLIGKEEGSFYQPKEDEDIRSFVVVTVRNSDIESIHADSYQPTGKSRRLLPGDIKAITTAAIEYFKAVDFLTLAEQIGELENDKYGRLAKKHPISWKALTQIANTDQQIVKYGKIPVIAKPNLGKLKPQQAVRNIFYGAAEGVRATQVTADGYTLTIDPSLESILQNNIENRLPFIVDSFKSVSRNTEKLLCVMEYALGNNIGFITSNYNISNGYAERRMNLVKPGHDYDEIRRNWLNGSRITKRHRGWLLLAARG